MRIHRPTSGRARRGATIVETAFVIPIALMFLFGIFEYGRFLMALHVANAAAHEGARYAAAHTGDNTVVGTMTDTANRTAAGGWASGSTIIGVVNTSMAGRQSDFQGYAVTVFTVTPSGLYNQTSGTPISPPTITPQAGSWNNAQFGGPIAVKITGNYVPILPNLLKMNASIPLTVTAMIGSEAN